MKNSDQAELDYRSLFSSLETAYIVFDVTSSDYTIIEQNQAHESISMIKRKDTVGRKLFDAFPDQSKLYQETGRSLLVESIKRAADTGQVDVMPLLNYDIKDTSGQFAKRYWRVSHAPIYRGKEVVAVIQQTEDITERIATEKELKLAQDQLEQALTYSAVGTWLWDIKNDRMIADKNSARLFSLGDGSEPYVGSFDDFAKSIDADDVDRVQAEIDRAINDQSAYESEYRVKGPDGGVYWLMARGHVATDDDGEPVEFTGLVVDITDRKQAEQRLHVLSEANTIFPASLGYRQTLDAIASIIVPHVADWCSVELLESNSIEQVVIAHKDPEKIKWAKQLRTEFGSPRLDAPSGTARVIRTGEIEHTPLITDDMLSHVAQNEKQLKLLRDVGMTSAITAPLKIEGSVIGAITFISTDPSYQYNEDDVEIAKGLANRAALAVYNANLFKEASTEIKERTKLQKKLEKLNAMLENRVKRRTEQLEKTNVGLELEIERRQSVESELQAYSEELARSNQELQNFAYVASHDLQEPLRKIRAFGDILQSEYEEGLGEGAEYLTRMQSAATRMSTLIQDLLAFSRVSTRDQVVADVDLNQIVKDVTVDLELQIQDLAGSIHVEQLPVVRADPTHMRQLFQNLITNALKFHRPDVPPRVTISVCESTDPGMSTICVEDNGIGFDERYLDRIFAVFQRLHGKDEYTGTGIGLAVVRKIVEQYGGTITASSKLNHGSTFKVSFPSAIEETIQ